MSDAAAANGDSRNYDTINRVDEFDQGVRLHVRCKRGTGTRDEDKVSGEIHLDTLNELETARPKLRQQVVQTMVDLRHSQPDEDLLAPDEQDELAKALTPILDTLSNHGIESGAISPEDLESLAGVVDQLEDSA